MRTRSIATSTALCVFWACAETRACIGARASQDLPIASYTTADGLPDESVSRVLADPRGFLWVGAATVLARFDGHGFVTYGSADGLDVGTGVNALALDGQGHLWIATNGAGIYRFDTTTRDPAARFTRFTVGDGRAANRVNIVRSAADDHLWAGTDAGLYLGRVGATFHRVTLPLADGGSQEAVQVLALAGDAGGVWVGTPAGLYRCGAPPVVACAAGPKLDGRSLLVDRAGTLWIGGEQGIHIWPLTGQKVPRRIAAGWQVRLLKLSNDAVFAGTEDGRVLAATEDGARVLHTLGEASPIHDIAEDAARNLWIATPRGLTAIRRQGVAVFAPAHGFHGATVRALRRHRSGSLYALSDDYWIHRISGARLTPRPLPVPKGVRPSVWPRTSLLVDAHGDIWLGTAAGLYRFAAGAAPGWFASAIVLRARYGTADGLAGDHIGELFEDSQGDIWIATVASGAETLTRFRRATSRFERMGEAHGLPAFNQPMAFAQDHGGAIWAGLREGGVVRVRGDRASVFGPSAGVPALVTAALVDAQGVLWLGGSDALVRVDSPAAQEIQAAPVLAGFGGRVLALAEAGPGRVAVGTTNGLLVTDATGRRVRSLSRYEGLPAGQVEALVRENPTSVLMIVANQLARWTEGPTPAGATVRSVVSRVRAGGQLLGVPDAGAAQIDDVEIPAGNNQIEIDFLGLSPRLGEPLTYEARLRGVSERWTAMAARRVSYVGLAAGRYTFEVRAAGAEGVTSHPARVAFVVLPPWYRRWWFLTAVAAVVLAAGYAAHRVRLAEAVRTERLRSTIATDLHDDIGSSLSQIAILAELTRRRTGEAEPTVAESLASIAATSRDLVDSMSDIVWAVSPRTDSLSDLTHRMHRFASETLGAADIALAFSGPPDRHDLKLPSDRRRQLYLILKESVSNIARHSGATSVTIDLQLRHRELRLSIADNGCGFDPGARYDGHGLASMRKRAAALRGHLTIRSAPGTGTTVSLTADVRG